MSRALVYNYFGDKFGLIAAVYVRWALELDRDLAAAFATGDPTAEDRIVARGVLALLERAALDRIDEPDLDRQAVEDLLFDLLWPGLSSRVPSPFD